MAKISLDQFGWKAVKVAGHEDKVLEALDELSSTA